MSSSESSDSEEYDWEDQKEMLTEQCEALNDQYLQVQIPRAELTRLVFELTELFEEKMDHHDPLIESEPDTENRAALVETAVEELTEILDRLAAAIRDNPSLNRRLSYGTSDPSSDSDYETD